MRFLHRRDAENAPPRCTDCITYICTYLAPTLQRRRDVRKRPEVKQRNNQREMAADDPRRILGEAPDSGFSYRPHRPSRPQRERPADTVHRVTTGGPRQSQFAPRQAKPKTMWDDLAALFIDQPWIHTYRGDTKPLENRRVDLGPTLVARLLQERADREPRFKGRSEEKIKFVVEYAMKHFFARVTNDQAGSKSILGNFLSDEWWPGMIEESIDHWLIVNKPITPEMQAEAQRKHDEFYANWPMGTAKPLSETAGRQIDWTAAPPRDGIARALAALERAQARQAAEAAAMVANDRPLVDPEDEMEDNA